jgi:hypothetical protein
MSIVAVVVVGVKMANSTVSLLRWLNSKTGSEHDDVQTPFAIFFHRDG